MVLLLCNNECHSFVSSPSYPFFDRPTQFYAADGASSDDEALSSSLSERIRQLQEKEAIQEDRLAMRIKGLQKAQAMEDSIVGQQQQQPQQVQLPAISFDALLPNQKLEGRTDDPTFCRFLQGVGLGGWFVMTSLDVRTRKIRRHGVLAKLEVMDDGAIYHRHSSSNNNEEDWVPTAVDFSILGHSRCRIVGPRNGMQARIGRWRRGYDPNGEESVLGWGDERFVDAPDSLPLQEEEDLVLKEEGDDKEMARRRRLHYSEWNSVLVDCNLEAAEGIATVKAEEREKMNELIPLVKDWYDLASNEKTYTNLNVTAATRVRRGHPGLW
eukprot:scaffold24884_cov108-Cylindrotheca_fusiformis.AAC.1